MFSKDKKFYLVRGDVLPEAMRKTIEVKELLEQKKAKSIFEAVQMVDVSRSAYYKYKDSVYPFRALVQEQIITLSLYLEDRTGNLSNVLATLAQARCNVLTIHQTVPIQGKANVTLSLDISDMKDEINKVLHNLRKLEFIERVEVLSSGV